MTTAQLIKFFHEHELQLDRAMKDVDRVIRILKIRDKHDEPLTRVSLMRRLDCSPIELLRALRMIEDVLLLDNDEPGRVEIVFLLDDPNDAA